MAERRNAQDECKATIEESNKNHDSDIEDDAESTHRPDGPGSRPLPPEAYCFKKTLISNDVNPDNARLYLEKSEACALLVCDDIAEQREGSYGWMLEVYDEVDRSYEMELKCNITGEVISCSMEGDWKKYVLNNQLKEGCEVTFYKNRDTKILKNGYYFIVKVTKRKAYDLTQDIGTTWEEKKPRSFYA